MNLGAEPKKVGVLAVLGLVAIYVVFFNPFADSPPQATQTASRPTPRPSPVVPVGTPTANPATVPGYEAPPAVRPGAIRKGGKNERVLQDFRPSLKPKRDEPRPDPTTMDPSLNLEILAKLQNVKVEGSHRSLFEFTAGPPADPTKTLVAGGKNPPSPFVKPFGPEPPPPKPVAVTPAPPPPPPPPPFKFYGFINAANQANKRAFFLEGDDIHVVTEGEVVKRRYRIVRIGVNSVVVEDTDSHNQSTLPLEEAPS